MNDHAIAAEPFLPRFLGDASALRDALQRAGFTQAAVEEVLDRRSERMVDAAVVTRRTATPSAFHTLVRLFVLNAVCDAEAVRAAVAPVAMEELVASGLCGYDGDGLRATARLMPCPEIVATRSVTSARRTAWNSQRVATKMAMGSNADPERGYSAPTDDGGGVVNDRLDNTRTRVPAAVLRRPASFRASADSGTSPKPIMESTGSTNDNGDKTPAGIRCLYGGPLPTNHPSFGDGADIGRREQR